MASCTDNFNSYFYRVVDSCICLKCIKEMEGHREIDGEQEALGRVGIAVIFDLIFYLCF